MQPYGAEQSSYTATVFVQMFRATFLDFPISVRLVAHPMYLMFQWYTPQFRLVRPYHVYDK